MSAHSTVAKDIATAVKARSTLKTSIYMHAVYVWYDAGVPVLTITHPQDGVVFEEVVSSRPEINQAMLVGFLTNQPAPTAQEIWENTDSSAFNWHTNEYLARSGEWGLVAPELDGEPDWTKAGVSHLCTWANPQF